MKLLVTGGRDYHDMPAFTAAMARLPIRVTMVIQGGAKGADRLAKQWASRNNIHCAEVLPLWDAFGKRAGHLRNEAMLQLQPDYCLAMPGGAGTRGMKAKAAAAGVPIWAPYDVAGAEV